MAEGWNESSSIIVPTLNTILRKYTHNHVDRSCSIGWDYRLMGISVTQYIVFHIMDKLCIQRVFIDIILRHLHVGTVARAPS